MPSAADIEGYIATGEIALRWSHVDRAERTASASTTCVGFHPFDRQGISSAAEKKREIHDDSERSLVLARIGETGQKTRWFLSGLL